MDGIPSDCIDEFASWEVDVIGNPSEFNIADMSFPNSSWGYSVGKFGLVLKTSDGGVSWDIVHIGGRDNSITELTLSSVSFINGDIGFIGGKRKECCSGAELMKGAVFLRTTDASNEWVKAYHQEVREFQDLLFIDESRGMAIATLDSDTGDVETRLLTTENGGESWKTIEDRIVRSSEFVRLDFNVYLLASGTDNIMTLAYMNLSNWNEWDYLSLPRPNCTQVYFATESIGFVICGMVQFEEEVFRTDDGGTSWTKVFDYPLTRNTVFHSSSELEWVVVNTLYENFYVSGEWKEEIVGYEFYYSIDGGNSWERYVSGDEACQFGGIYYRMSNSRFITAREQFNNFLKF